MDKFWHHFDRQFSPRAVRLLFWFTMLYGITSACGGGVKVQNNMSLGKQPTYCFRANFNVDKVVKTYSWNCYENNNICKNALKIAKKYGSFASVTSLTNCIMR